jgi:guanosine-3',5'-bis(diphosphate) 3'-pyrophosphohydrolase
MNCPECGSDRTNEKPHTRKFPYGPGDDAPILTATIPVIECKICHFKWTDWRAEAIRDQVIEEHKQKRRHDVWCFEQAIAYAMSLHRGQTDKIGDPYILHPLAVSATPGLTMIERAVAVLHDVLEDCSIHESDLRGIFDDEVADAVVAMTKQEGEDYMAYLARVADNPIALKVKICDIQHNTSLSRLGRLSSEVREKLVAKYNMAMEFLQSRMETIGEANG